MNILHAAHSLAYVAALIRAHLADHRPVETNVGATTGQQAEKAQTGVAG